MGEIFERPLPQVSLEWTGERLTTATAGQVEIEHLHRYFLARSLSRELDVLDVASGEGYGSALLAQVARSVVGVEVSSDAVAHAAAAYQASNLRFLEGDARSLPLDDASVDVVVSFETIEHFYEHEAFLAEVRRVLRPGGRLIVSSPDRDVYSPAGSDANPFHVRELSRGEFEHLLRGAFGRVHIVGQRLMLGSALVPEDGQKRLETLTFEKRGAQHFEAGAGLPRSAYAIAIASDDPIGEIPNSLYIETDSIGSLINRAAEADAVKAAYSAARDELAVSAQQVQLSISEKVAATDALAVLRAELSMLREELAPSLQDIRVSVAERIVDPAALTSLRSELTALKEELQVSIRHAQMGGRAEEQLAALRGELEAARAETSDACRQRDAMRIALRRVVRPLASRDELEAMYAQLGQSRAELEAIKVEQAADRAEIEAARAKFSASRDELEAEHAQLVASRDELQAMNAQFAAQMELAEYWQGCYEGLRSRLETTLRRTGIALALRLIPSSLRRTVSQRLLGPPRA